MKLLNMKIGKWDNGSEKIGLITDKEIKSLKIQHNKIVDKLCESR